MRTQLPGRATLAVFFGLLGGIGDAPAATPATATNLTLAAAVDVALCNNAELKSRRDKWDAMQERMAQAGALPNPMFTYGGMDMASGGAWPDTSEKRFMVQQELPWCG